MGLSFDFTRCADSKSLIGEDASQKERVISESIIWYTMFTDIGWAITQDNAGEFYARINLLEKLDGPMMKDGEGNDLFVTPEDVFKRIGLKVNVAPKTRLQWTKRVTKRIMDKAVAEYNEAAKGL